MPKTHAKCFYQVSYVTNKAEEKVLLRLGVNEIRRYDPSADLRSAKLGERVSPVMNKIRALRPEAFWYWMEIERMMKG